MAERQTEIVRVRLYAHIANAVHSKDILFDLEPQVADFKSLMNKKAKEYLEELVWEYCDYKWKIIPQSRRRTDAKA